MTYLPWYGEYSSTLAPDTQINGVDFSSELILYFEQKKYELWYCIHNPDIAAHIMSIDPDLVEKAWFTLPEYATLKIDMISDCVDKVMLFSEQAQKVTKKELTTYLEEILITYGGIVDAKVLTAEWVSKLAEQASDQDESKNEENEEEPLTLDDVFGKIESNIYGDEMESYNKLIDFVNESPFPVLQYSIAENCSRARADDFLDVADDIYKLFTEMSYSQEAHTLAAKWLPQKMYRRFQMRSTSSDISYLTWVAAKNFVEHRESAVRADPDYEDLTTKIHHNNYRALKVDILYDIFRAQYCVENDLLPENLVLHKWVYTFKKYEEQIDEPKKKYREGLHKRAVEELERKFNAIPLYEDGMDDKVQQVADSGSAKVAAIIKSSQ